MEIANKYEIYIGEDKGKLEVTTSNRFPDYLKVIEEKDFLHVHRRKNDTSSGFYNNFSESVEKSVDSLVQKLENHLKQNGINFDLSENVFSSEVYLNNDFNIYRWGGANKYSLDENSNNNCENFVKQSELFLKDYLKRYKIVSAISHFIGGRGF